MQPIVTHNKTVVLTIVTLLLISCFPAEASTRLAQKQITVVFRFDDISAKSHTEIEEKLIASFRELGMRCTFGVIPFMHAGVSGDPALQKLLALPQAKSDMLRQAVHEGVLEVALHGYSHQTNGLGKKGYSEFAGLDYEEQLERIRQGKQFLEEELKIPVTIFIPPWNSYDSNTIRALEQSGFQCLSADTSGPAGSSGSLKFLPVSCGPADLKNAVEAARNIPDPAPVVTMLFHEFEFKEVGDPRGVTTYDDFFSTLTWLSSQEDVRIRSIDQLSDIGCDRYISNRARLRLARLLPRRLRWKGGEFVFLSLKGAQSVKSKDYALVFVFYASVLSICAILSFAFGTTVFSRVPVLSKFILFVGLVVLLVGSIYTFHDLNVGMKGLAAIAGVLGCCIGTFGARCWTLRHRRQVS